MQRDEVSKDDVLKDEGVPSAMPITPATSIAPPSATADLLRTAADPALTEDFALAILKRPDLPAEVLEQLAKNSSALKSRKLKMALAGHAHTPRHVSVPLARQFYTFDLMKLALSPGLPTDGRVAVDDVLISRLKTVTVGERLTSARRASGRVAAALLLDVADVDGKTPDATPGSGRKVNAGRRPRESRVMQTALDNPRLTEALVINSVLRLGAGASLVRAVSRHVKWSCRKEIRAALLRTEYLSLALALEFSQEIPAAPRQELLNSSRLPEKIKELLLRE